MAFAPTLKANVPLAAVLIGEPVGATSPHEPLSESATDQVPEPFSKFWKYGKVLTNNGFSALIRKVVVILSFNICWSPATVTHDLTV